MRSKFPLTRKSSRSRLLWVLLLPPLTAKPSCSPPITLSRSLRMFSWMGRSPFLGLPPQVWLAGSRNYFPSGMETRMHPLARKPPHRARLRRRLKTPVRPQNPPPAPLPEIHRKQWQLRLHPQKNQIVFLRKFSPSSSITNPKVNLPLNHKTKADGTARPFHGEGRVQGRCQQAGCYNASKVRAA